MIMLSSLEAISRTDRLYALVYEFHASKPKLLVIEKSNTSFVFHGPLATLLVNSNLRETVSGFSIENSLKFGNPFFAPITHGMPYILMVVFKGWAVLTKFCASKN